MANQTISFAPVVLSNSDLAKTFPFFNSDVSRKFRKKVLKRTKHRRFWFSKAEELDKNRGTQLGTLGFLPWEIRQKVIENVFDVVYENCWAPKYEYINLETLENRPRMYFGDHFPGEWSSWRTSTPEFLPIVHLRDTSASIKVEVEYTFLTKTTFGFDSPNVLKYFLGSLTTYQKSLLRSFTMQLPTPGNLYGKVNADNKAWMEACAQLPPGLTSIKFGFNNWSMDRWEDSTSSIYDDDFGFLELLSNRVRRCWAPRAKLGKEPRTLWEPILGKRGTASSVFYKVEDWSKEWLEWWDKSQESDETEV